MAKRNRVSKGADVDKRIKEGRGQGTGFDYKPWLLVQNVPSRGLVTRIKGWKTTRVHHLLSNLELNYFYVLEWSPKVCDIREQYPLLPLSETIAIAQQCGIRHPLDPKTQQPVVMTTDFLITMHQPIGVKDLARTIKLAKDLLSERTLEKLEIERRYWLKRDIDWGIVTEHEIPETLAKNVEWLHPFQKTTDLSPLTEPEINRIATTLNLRITIDSKALADMTAECDDQLGLFPGTSLSVSRHLIANRQWQVDMNKPIQPSQQLVLLATPITEVSRILGGAE
ncbi:heteromeric transposase endonuclease subunit TnsA [Scytonema sp. UIC 10036]|uniref:TnsA endonuclease N-terminal domain-containing protein n=1 Tax=Scytonema sp. UIC 10036 TaxID=2304196 RepID=UPI0012DAB649|nr:TnsA endonuclease N-terminal domain-containing protein [Scytonema sp. UIC 10036]MUG92904.1 heteromeric transposase endonuclease subunit TnsA [Scytonema sp. UIC 10036]